MKVCILGAGAVGGLMGARMARAGHDVSALARGATLEAFNHHGFRVTERAKDGAHMHYGAPVRAVSSTRILGPQDLVVIAVKAPALRAMADAIEPLLGRDTVVLSAMNGVPWWFFQRGAGAHTGLQVEAVDPGGEVARRIPVEHVLGGVVHWSSSCPEPGLVELGFGNRFILGEPSGASTPRLERMRSALAEAGFDVEISADVRRDVWYKLWGNLTVNPVSALTGATVDRILDDPQVVAFFIECMRETAEIGSRIGCPISESGETRLGLARHLGPFRTSMLQDVDARRPVELDALVTAASEIGAKVGVPTPSIDALLGLARLHARVLGLYPERRTDTA